MILHPILKPFCDLKRFHGWLLHNFKHLFPNIPEYSRITRLFNNNRRKERQWIENVFGFLKTKFGLDKIRVRKMPSFLARLYAILCCYNIFKYENIFDAKIKTMNYVNFYNKRRLLSSLDYKIPEIKQLIDSNLKIYCLDNRSQHMILE